MEERDPETYAIIGAAMEVHGVLGPGFLEAVYHQALMREFTFRGIPYRHEIDLPVFYKGDRLEAFYRCDFLCYDSVMVEVKAIRTMTGADESQLVNYLTASKMQRGLLLNFGALSL